MKPNFNINQRLTLMVCFFVLASLDSVVTLFPAEYSGLQSKQGWGENHFRQSHIKCLCKIP